MALTHVRKAFGINGYGSESVILRRGMIYLNPELEIYTDYELFTEIAQSTLENTVIDSPVMADLLEQAAELYQGDFLPDNLYDDWTAILRALLRHLCLQVLLKLIEFYRRHGKTVHALQACNRYLVLEPVDEPVSRTAMELLWQRGQKQQALSLYKRLAAALAKEYGMMPAAETNDLYKKIRFS